MALDWIASSKLFIAYLNFCIFTRFVTLPLKNKSWKSDFHQRIPIRESFQLYVQRAICHLMMKVRDLPEIGSQTSIAFDKVTFFRSDSLPERVLLSSLFVKEHSHDVLLRNSCEILFEGFRNEKDDNSFLVMYSPYVNFFSFF
jgi:hypothetical protein